MPNFPYKEPLIQAVILQSCKAFSLLLLSRRLCRAQQRWNLLFRVILISASHLFVLFFFSTFSMYVLQRKRLKRRRWGRFYNLVHFSKEGIITDYLSITIRDTLDLHCSQNVAMAAINHRLDRIKPNRRAGFDNNWTELLIWQTLLTMLLDGFVSQLHNWSAHFSSDSKDPRTYHYRSYLTFEPFFMPFNNWWMIEKSPFFLNSKGSNFMLHNFPG